MNSISPVSSKLFITNFDEWQPVAQISCPALSSSVAGTM